MKIGIVGNGFVGKATKLLACPSVEIVVYDIRPEACEPLGTTLEDLETCDLVFYCLPTPIGHNGSCHTKILEDAVKLLKNPYKVIRSTVPIGFSDSIDCFFMPEFLTEANWKEDFITSSHWVFGTLSNDNNSDLNRDLNREFIRRITMLFQTSKRESAIHSDTLYFVKSCEAEFLKLTKNCFLAAKVGIFNELYQLAQVKGVDIKVIRDLCCMDNRLGTTHMNVPGIGGKFGYGGTCFPKDTHSLYNQFQAAGVPSYYFQTSLVRNESVDRPEREWAVDYWRTTIPTDRDVTLVVGGGCTTVLNKIKELLNKGEIVIYMANGNNDLDVEHENFYKKKGTFTSKQFFPKLNSIWLYDKNVYSTKRDYAYMKDHITQIFNILELLSTHKATMYCDVDPRDTLTYDLLTKFKQDNKDISIYW
jgi:UDPglucose 6-dehydrogenase